MRQITLRALGLVGAGGALGTALRFLIDEVTPQVWGLPVSTFAINITGAFLLGWLIETLANRGPDTGRRRDLRLLLGTGVLGGFTTYSALAVDAAGLIRDGQLLLAIGYSLGTVLLGALASIAGVATAQHRASRRSPRQQGGHT